MSNEPEVAVLRINGEDILLPVREDSFGGVKNIDVRDLFKKHNILINDPGYRSTASCQSEITYIDGNKGVLLYRGYPIEQLAQDGSFVETSYLLLFGERPSKESLSEFESNLIQRMQLTPAMMNGIEMLGSTMTPIDMLQSAILVACPRRDYPDEDEARRDQALEVIAKMPALVAAAHRLSKMEKTLFIAPDPALGFTENFLRMCFADAEGKYTPNGIVTNAVDRLFILHADHEQNASTASVRQVGSTKARLCAAVSAGIGALGGSAHGGANEAVFKTLKEIGCRENIPAYINRVTSGHGKVVLPGVGHGVYKTYDPRAAIMKKDCDCVLNDLGIENPLLNLAKDLEVAVLREPYFRDRQLYPNVDFYSGIILSAVGFSPEIFTAVFALSRTSGWTAQWLEMVTKEPVLCRPHQWYRGEFPRDYEKAPSRAEPNPSGTIGIARNLFG